MSVNYNQKMTEHSLKFLSFVTTETNKTVRLLFSILRLVKPKIIFPRANSSYSVKKIHVKWQKVQSKVFKITFNVIFKTMLSGMYGKVQSNLLNILQIKLYNQQLFESARKKNGINVRDAIQSKYTRLICLPTTHLQSFPDLRRRLSCLFFHLF